MFLLSYFPFCYFKFQTYLFLPALHILLLPVSHILCCMKRPVARLLEPCREACGQSDIDNRCAGVTPLTVATTPSLGAGHVMKNARYSPAATTTTSCQILRIWRKVLQACGDWSLRPSVPSDASQGWLVHLTMEG